MTPLLCRFQWENNNDNCGVNCSLGTEKAVRSFLTRGFCLSIRLWSFILHTYSHILFVIPKCNSIYHLLTFHLHIRSMSNRLGSACTHHDTVWSVSYSSCVHNHMMRTIFDLATKTVFVWMHNTVHVDIITYRVTTRLTKHDLPSRVCGVKRLFKKIMGCIKTWERVQL